MKFGSLFSGVGGFDLGFERAGMTCVWQAENNKYSNQVLARHWPNVKRYEDVRDVGRNAEAVDLICGGFPCQDLSVAGKRAGLAGERSGLWFEFRRIIEELAPTWVVIENVPGLLSSNKGRDMAILLGGLAQLGYRWAYRVLDSQYYGVAQRRRRVFIVANLGDATAAAKILFESESRDWDSAPSRDKGQGFTHPTSPSLRASGNGVAKASNERGQDPVVAVPEIAHPVTTKVRNAGDSSQENFVVTPRTVNVRGGKDGGGKGYLESENGMTLGGQPQWLFSLQQGVADQNGRGWNDDGSAYTLSGSGAGTIAGNAIGRSDENGPQRGDISDGVSHTLNQQDRHATNDTIGVRRLTPTECERLQGFPDGWTEGQSDTQRYKMMGNAVTVPVIEWLGKRIVMAKNDR